MFRAFVNSLRLSFFTIVASGCDVSGNNVAGIDGSGSPVASNVSTGTIDGFGSIIVNGVRYDTRFAEITVSGDVSSESDLSVGAYVTVLGEVNQDDVSGSAAQVIFQPNVVGLVSGIDLTQDTLIVLGQTVRVNSETSFDPAISGNGLSGLNVNDRVRVSGPVNAANEIIATRIDLAANAELEILGQTASLDRTAMTFNLGNVVIDYSQAILEDMDILDLANGQRLIVEGTQFDGTTLIATFIEQEENYFDQVDEQSEIEIEGFITEFRSLASFSVGTTEVSAGDNTEVFGGQLSGLDVDVFVEIVGTFNGQNVLEADEIAFVEFDTEVISGFVSDINIENDENIPVGSFLLQGTSVVTTVHTRYEDESEADVPQFNLTHINVGDFLTVVGGADDAGFVASSIERLGSEDLSEVALQGLLENEGEIYFLYGYRLEFFEEVEFSINDEEVTQEEFFTFASEAFAEAVGFVEGDMFVVESINLVLD